MVTEETAKEQEFEFTSFLSKEKVRQADSRAMGKFNYITRPFVVTTLANAFGSFQLGYNIGVASNIQDVIQDFMNLTITDREGSEPSEDRLTNLWAITVAILFIGIGIGAYSNKWLSERASRRRSLFYNIILGCASSIVLFISKRTELWEILLAGRFLIGLHVGLYASLVPVYLAEISPKEIRGAMSSLHPLFLVTAFLFAQTLGFPSVFGNRDLWDYVFGVTLLPCLFQLALLSFCVESPRYFMATDNGEIKARKALQQLRGSNNVEEEIEEMKEEVNKFTKSVPLVQLFKHPPYRRATVLVLTCHITLQLSGLNGVLLYSNTLLQDAVGLSQADASYTMAGMGALSIVMLIVATLLSDVAGRRTLQLVGLAGCAVSHFMTALCLALRHEADGLGVATIVSLLLFMIFFNVGPGTVPWIIMGEYFPPEVKPTAAPLAVACDFLCGFAVAYIFPPMEKAMGGYVFIPFGVYVIFIFIYIYLKLPETKGKTFDQITRMFEVPSKSNGRCMDDIKGQH